MTTVAVGMNMESLGMVITDITGTTIVNIIMTTAMIGTTAVIMVDIVMTIAAGTTIEPR